jgi:ATP-dependent RNA/DNA helicase IGHMBP2
MPNDGRASLAALRLLWQREQQAVNDRFRLQRQTLPLRDRIERGLALRALAVEELDAAPGDRLRMWLRCGAPEGLSDDLRIGPGDPVLLWRQSPDEPDAVRAVVSRRRGDLLGVVVDGDAPTWLEEEDGFKLDLDNPDTTFKRGFQALRRFDEADRGSDRARLRAVLFGDRVADFRRPREPDLWFDPSLNEPQRHAIRQAIAAEDVALIHGPPGTGKTRTLIEVIRQAVHSGQKVLASAASNLAVDNLVERLDAAGVRVIRLGHPARVTDAAQSCTLDAKLEQNPLWRLTREWIDQANTIRRRANIRTDRGALSYAERRQALSEANGLMRDARRNLAGLQNALLDAAQVICVTAAGADSPLVDRRDFDLVVIDEATQAADPIALVPIAQGRRVVLAGDPHQLPPTVISLDAQPPPKRSASSSPDDDLPWTLAETMFERLTQRPDAALHCMLEVQHRMHESLMFFPSESKYGGRLRAAPEVAAHVIEGLPCVAPDPLRPGPLVLIDTAGKGWTDERVGAALGDAASDPSIRNPGAADRAVAEVARLLGRGVEASDLAVITPYAGQARLLRQRLTAAGARGVEVGTIDGFQGREKEAVILDLVRSNDEGQIGFLRDTRRMNVALTRARRLLIVIADATTLGQHPYYKQFFDAAELLGAWISAWADDAPPFEG